MIENNRSGRAMVERYRLVPGARSTLLDQVWAATASTAAAATRMLTTMARLDALTGGPRPAAMTSECEHRHEVCERALKTPESRLRGSGRIYDEEVNPRGRDYSSRPVSTSHHRRSTAPVTQGPADQGARLAVTEEAVIAGRDAPIRNLLGKGSSAEQLLLPLLPAGSQPLGDDTAPPAAADQLLASLRQIAESVRDSGADIGPEVNDLLAARMERADALELAGGVVGAAPGLRPVVMSEQAAAAQGDDADAGKLIVILLLSVVFVALVTGGSERNGR